MRGSAWILRAYILYSCRSTCIHVVLFLFNDEVVATEYLLFNTCF